MSFDAFGGMFAYLVFFLTMALIYGTAVLGLNLQWGFTGLFNAGVVGFMALGAYGTAILSGPPHPGMIGGFNWPYPLAVLAGVGISGIGALIVGLITLRLREEYLAIATFGIAITVQLVALNADSLTGGAIGLAGLPRPLLQTLDSPPAFNLFFLLLAAISCALVHIAFQRAVQSPWGRLLKAIREDEDAAAALGKNPTSIRLQSFILGCMAMGLSGALYTGFIGYVSPADFQPILTFQIWAMLIVGGAGNNRGALAGSLLVWAVWTLTGIAISRILPPGLQAQGGAIQVMLIGLMIVLTLLLRPRGLIGERTEVSRHAE